MTLSSPATWTTVEPGVGIIAACLPRLKPLLDRFLRAIRRSATNSRDCSRQLDSGHTLVPSPGDPAPGEPAWELLDVEHKPASTRVTGVDGFTDTPRYARKHPAEIATAVMHNTACWDYMNKLMANERIQPVRVSREPAVIRLETSEYPSSKPQQSDYKKHPGDSVGWAQKRDAYGRWEMISVEDLRLCR